LARLGVPDQAHLSQVEFAALFDRSNMKDRLTVAPMFEVLNFVYENYWQGDACPELPALQRTLCAVGFESTEIQEALVWIEELKLAARQFPCQTEHTVNLTEPMVAPSSNAVRLLSTAEQQHLDRDSWGFLIFLVSTGTLSSGHLELVMERVMATPSFPIDVDEIKLIVLMVFWSLGEEPDALVLDELCDNRATRTGH
jgi:Smg protein